MANKLKHKIFKRLKMVILTILIFFTSLVIIGIIYEQISRSISEDKFLPDGEFINIGSHRLHYLKKGNGRLTIIFESGLYPGGHLPWYKVQNECSKFTTTISYDRSGVLWSERGNNPKNCKEISDELSKLLIETNCPKPYIVVGHSLAGLFLRDFIVKNKNDINGVIFIDVSHPEQDKRESKELKELSKPISPWLIKFVNATGLLRLFYDKSYPTTNSNDSINQIVYTLFHKGVPTFIEEQNSVKNLLIESEKYDSFGSIPLKIVTGYSPDRYDEIKNEKLRSEFFDNKMELQKDLLNLSSNSEQIFANQSGHYVQLEQPEIIVNLIRDLVGTSINKNVP